MKEQHIITFKKLIENSAWFGVLNYEDKIFVGKDLNKVLEESEFARNIDDLIEYNMAEHKGCFMEDEWVFCAGKTKQDVVKKLRNQITNIQEV
jgi:hypothetical protein